MRLWLLLAWRDISRNLRFSLLFILNLAIGFTGFLLIGSFGSSLTGYLDNNLKEILTADLMLQSSRPLSAEEVQASLTAAGEGSRMSEQISLFSMVRGKSSSRLTQIVAIDDAFPLYGRFEYLGQQEHAEVMAGLLGGNRILMGTEVAGSFNLALGDTLHIGQKEYEVAFFHKRDPGSEVTSIELAPKIYMGLPQLQESGLIRFGSRITYKRYIRLPALADAGQVAVRLKEYFAAAKGNGPEVRVFTTLDVNRRLGQVVEYFTGYMGLVGMISLFLAGLTAVYLFRQHLRHKLKETAILLSLGAKRWQCLALSSAQLAFLGLVGALLATAFARLLLPLFSGLLQGLISQDIPLAVHPRDAGIALAAGAVGGLLFCLPVYHHLYRVKPLQLLREAAPAEEQRKKEVLMRLAGSLPAIGMFFFLASLLSGSFRQGAYFTGGMAAVALLLIVTGGLLLRRCRFWSHSGNLTRKIVFRNLFRNRLSVLPLFVAIAMATLLMNIIPQIEKGLLAEIAQPEDMTLPVFFLVDIQEEQKEPLSAFFQQTDHHLSSIAPMVQGRIRSVNGMAFARWREQRQVQGESRIFRRSDFNFSSRDELDPSETVIEGVPVEPAPWSPESGRPFEISMEERFSERLGVSIGDRLVFDIQGLEMEGKVVNLRKVRWNSFQPNFFLLFQKGVLDNAPRTYLASVGNVAPGEKQALLNSLAQEFPNVSAIDVTRTVEQIGDITLKLTGALRFMAYLAIITGLVAVLSTARHEALQREKELNLLRVLGAGTNRIRGLIMLEFGLLGGAAGCVSVGLGYGCSYWLSWLFFDRIWRFQWQSGAFMIAGATLICALAAFLAAEAVVRRKPVALLG